MQGARDWRLSGLLDFLIHVAAKSILDLSLFPTKVSSLPHLGSKFAALLIRGEGTTSELHLAWSYIQLEAALGCLILLRILSFLIQAVFLFIYLLPQVPLNSRLSFRTQKRPYSRQATEAPRANPLSCFVDLPQVMNSSLELLFHFSFLCLFVGNNDFLFVTKQIRSTRYMPPQESLIRCCRMTKAIAHE